MEAPLSIHGFPRAILHIDGDAFFASCEQSRDPSLKGKPVAILHDGSRLPIATKNVKEGQKLTLGIRPEHLQMADAGLAGEVLVVEPLGMMTQVVVKAAGTHVELMVLERTDIAPGAKVKLAINPTYVHTFDRTNGRRIE